MIQQPLFQPDVDWKPPKISDLPSWADARRVSVDCETRDDHIKKLGPGVRRGGYICGYSFAIEDGPSHYVPLRHEGGGNVPNPQAALQYLRDQSKVFKGSICGAGLQYDLDYFAEQDIIFREAEWFRDVQIAEPLLDELQMSYSLENIAKRRGIPGKDEGGLFDVGSLMGIKRKDIKGTIWRMPAQHVAAYGIQDAELPLQLLRRQEREIDEENLWDIYNLESKLLPVLVKVRRRGVRVNFDQLDKVAKWSLVEEGKALEEVYTRTLVRVAVGDVWKVNALVPVLQSIGVTVPMTVPKGKSKPKESVSNDWLKSLNHPVAIALYRARKINKLRTTFANSVREHAVGDRIHCTLNQLRRTDDETGDDKGARYGRLSCTLPNLQQQPSRDDPKHDLYIAKRWRSIYVPDEGGLWACDDYSQQEPRWLVHYAEHCHLNPKLPKFNFPSASVAAAKYRDDPNTDNHTMMARIVYDLGDNEQPTKDQRTAAKIIYLGLCYGMGGGKLARSLGLPTIWKDKWNGIGKYEAAGQEAQAVLDLFNTRAPFIRGMAKECERRAKRRGFIKTVLGRHCRFPKKTNGGWDWCHKGLNRLIQGSSGDQTKKAMVDADAAGYRVQLQVHDELDLTVENRGVAEGLAIIMRECVTANVPFKVDVEIGPSWGEIK